MKRLVLSLLALAVLHTDAALQPVRARDEPHVYRNEWTETDTAGHQVRVVRWPIGTRDHVVELRIPPEYIEFAGGCAGFGPGQPDPNCLQPFSTTAPLLRAMLPDLSPVPHRPLSPDEQARVVHIMVDSVFFGRDKTVEETLAIHAYISLDNFAGQEGAFLHVSPWDQSLLVYKEPRFNLKRIGLLGTASAEFPGSFHDFLFSASGIEQAGVDKCQKFEAPPIWRSGGTDVLKCKEWVESSDFMRCADESIPTSDVKKSGDIPLCEQWFGDIEASAVITLQYERQHLRDWQAIKDNVSNFLNRLDGDHT